MSGKLAEVLRKASSVPLHPFLLAAYPVLALYATNVAEIPLVAALRPLAVTLVLGVLPVG